GHPPVGLVVRVAMLDKVHLGIAGIVERRRSVELIVRFDRNNFATAALHTLKEQKIAGDMLMNQIKRKQRVAQVIQNPHKDNQVELLSNSSNVPYREAAELDLRPLDLSGETSLTKIVFVRINTQHASCAAALHLERVEPRIASDIKHGLTRKIGRQCMTEGRELQLGVVAEKVVGSGLNAIEAEIMKPGTESPDLLLKNVLFNGA